MKTVVSTSRAPQAIGTYSQAVRIGDVVYLSGQIPLVPESGQLVTGDMRVQVARVFDNLKAVAEAAGGSLVDVVKLNVFLTDLAHFPVVNEVMAQYFRQPYPARAAIGVTALPRGAGVEMDAVMVLGKAKTKKARRQGSRSGASRASGNRVSLRSSKAKRKAKKKR